MWWKRTTATLFGVLFGTYRRRRRDVLMGHGGCVPLRRLSDVPLRRRWVFHLWLVLRRRGDVLIGRCYVLLRHCGDVPIWCCGDVPLRCLGDVPSRLRCGYQLKRNCDFAGTYRETTLRRRHNLLLPVGFSLLSIEEIKLFCYC